MTRHVVCRGISIGSRGKECVFCEREKKQDRNLLDTRLTFCVVGWASAILPQKSDVVVRMLKLF